MDEAHIHAIIYDSYEEQALRLDFWLDSLNEPTHCEILWEGKRVLSVDVEKFEVL